LDEVLLQGHPVILDVYADWCGPCKLMEPVLQALALRLSVTPIRVLQINSDLFPAKAAALRVDALPSVLFLRGGAEVHRVEGLSDVHELTALAEEMLGADAPEFATIEYVDSAVELELALAMEDALVLGVVAPGQAEEDSMMVEPALDLLRDSLDGRARVLLVDAERFPEEVASLGARAVPSVLFFAAGQCLGQAAGQAQLRPQELLRLAGGAFQL